jgi:putative ABC transport system permease protein
MLHDLRTALRQLAKAPGFTAVVIFTLALGIGACTAIFSVVRGVILKPLPYPAAERIAILGEVDVPGERPVGGSVAVLNFLDYREQNTVFEGLAATSGRGATLAIGDGEPQRILTQLVSANYFDILGVAPVLGRNFTAEDDQTGAARVALIGHELWQTQFGGRADVLGRQVLLNGEPTTIIGVLPEMLRRVTTYQLWVPIAFSERERSPANRGAHYLNVLGRLKPDVTAAQAQTEMNAIAERLEQQFPQTNRGVRITVMPYLDYLVGPTRPVLLALFAAVGALLLIACANVANLLLARATSRTRELAVRTALGAGRARIIRQLLTESVLLAGLGGALGLLTAHWGLDALLALAPGSLPRASEVAVDRGVLLFVTGLVGLTGVAFGLVPALQASRVDLVNGLKDGARGSGESGSRRRLRDGFVVAEIALSLVLLVCAGLLMRSFARLQSADAGFRPEHVTILTATAPARYYPTPEQRIALADRFTERIRALPGVVAVGATNALPLGGTEDVFGFYFEGRPQPEPTDMPVGTYYVVDSGYFEAIGTAIVRGRAFTPQDRLGSAPVAIVSQGVADQFFPGEDPIGKRISITNGPESWREIVGVVQNVRHLGLDDSRPLQIYEPLAQRGAGVFNFTVRSAGANPGLAPALRALVRELDPRQPVTRLSAMDSLVEASLARARFGMTLFAVFSGLALLLATLGIYGVMAYTVSQRTAEFGVRMALGAQTSDVRRLVLGQAARLAGIGLALGLAGAIASGRLLEALLYNTSTHDPLVLAGLTVVLAAVALLAAWLPARRASRVDPMIALRAE